LGPGCNGSVVGPLPYLEAGVMALRLVVASIGFWMFALWVYFAFSPPENLPIIVRLATHGAFICILAGVLYLVFSPDEKW